MIRDADKVLLDDLRRAGRGDVADYWEIVARAEEGGAFDALLDGWTGTVMTLDRLLRERVVEIAGPPPKGFTLIPRINEDRQWAASLGGSLNTVFQKTYTFLGFRIAKETTR